MNLMILLNFMSPFIQLLNKYISNFHSCIVLDLSRKSFLKINSRYLSH